MTCSAFFKTSFVTKILVKALGKLVKDVFKTQLIVVFLEIDNTLHRYITINMAAKNTVISAHFWCQCQLYKATLRWFLCHCT